MTNHWVSEDYDSITKSDYSITEERAICGQNVPINKEYEELRSYSIFRQLGKTPESSYKVVLQGVFFGKHVKVADHLTAGAGPPLRPNTAWPEA